MRGAAISKCKTIAQDIWLRKDHKLWKRLEDKGRARGADENQLQARQLSVRMQVKLTVVCRRSKRKCARPRFAQHLHIDADFGS